MDSSYISFMEDFCMLSTFENALGILTHWLGNCVITCDVIELHIAVVRNWKHPQKIKTIIPQ